MGAAEVVDRSGAELDISRALLNSQSRKRGSARHYYR